MADTSPYDEIYQLLQSTKPEPDTEQMQRDKRIARINTFGEALKSLVDVVGGAAGANVQKREVPTVLSKAVDDYNKNKLLYTQQKDNWDKQGINLKLRELADRMARQKLDEAQENFTSKLAQEAAKTEQLPIEKEKQRQFLAGEWEKNRQARIKAAQISASKKNQAQPKIWQDKPDYHYYDQQTGQSIPMLDAHVDRIIGEMRKDANFKGEMGTLDGLIKIDPPAAKEEKRRLVQQYGDRYKDLIYAMSQNTPYAQSSDDSPQLNNWIRGLYMKEPSDYLDLNSVQGLSTPAPEVNPVSNTTDVSIQERLMNIHNDKTLSERAKKVKMAIALMNEGYSKEEAKRKVLENYK
jgi:hypothetical protein